MTPLLLTAATIALVDLATALLRMMPPKVDAMMGLQLPLLLLLLNLKVFSSACDVYY